MICRRNDLPTPPLPILVTGIAGVAGLNVFHYLHNRFPGQVIGVRPVNNWPMQGEGIIGADVEDAVELQQLYERYRFASVVNCAGSCALKACELDPDMSYRINVTGVRNLLDLVNKHQLRLVHLSIDLVYSGAGDGGYRESDPADPVTVYGKTMSIAESLIQLTCPKACMLRISLPMGVSFNGHAGAIDWIQARFQKDKPATLYFDEVRTPTYVDCLSRVCQLVLASELRGLYHAGGQRRLSLYEIAQIVNRVGGYDPDLLMGCPRIDAGPMPPRAGNVTMVSKRLEEDLGEPLFDPWPIDEHLVPTDRKWHYDRPSDQTHSFEHLMNVLYRNPACPDPIRFEDFQNAVTK